MKKTAFITGIAGQDGVYLGDLLISKGYRVIGLSLSTQKNDLKFLANFGLLSKITVLKGSILDKKLIKKILLKYQLHEFYNLAGQSSVAKSWEDSAGTMAINGTAVLVTLELIKRFSPKTKFFQCSSAEIYGNSSQVINEKNNKFNPLSPYGSSKLFAHQAVINFREKYGLFACNGILFNHESPLRPDFMVSKKIARGVADILSNKEKELVLGNLLPKRDWGFAGDFVKAMWLMLQQTHPDDFVICTGRTYSINDYLNLAFKIVGIKNWQSLVKIDQHFVRKQEIKDMRGSCRKVKQKLGWRPEVNFERLVYLMLDYELC